MAPCNCGKRKKRPATSSKPKPTEQKGQPQQGKTQSFTLTTWSGKTLQFGSRLEAEAYNQRDGGGGTVKPA